MYGPGITRRRQIENMPPFSPFTDTFKSGSGTVAVPSGATGLEITVVGGGGGGARRNSGIAYGGGGGARAVSATIVIVVGDVGKLLPYSVGAPGVGKTASTGVGMQLS